MLNVTPVVTPMTAKSSTEAWLHMLNALVNTGKMYDPRNMSTMELIGYRSVMQMDCPIISIPKRKLNYKFMCGEACWILSGSNHINDIEPYMSAIKQYSDNGIHFSGAYGPKVVDQLQYVCECLTEDESSRQAVISIWRENPRPSKDIPCTLTLQFLIRDNNIHCVANMRSSDAWLGWVYDTFNFSMIAAWIAIYLRTNNIYPNLQMGELTLNAGSQHLYERNWKEAQKIIDHVILDKDDVIPYDLEPIKLSDYNHPDQLINELRYYGKIHNHSNFIKSIGTLI